jgi:hypothetical protein
MDTEEGRNEIAAVRKAIAGWKARGMDVRDIEDYLENPNASLDGIKLLLEAALKEGLGQHAVVEPDECPKCFAEISPALTECPSCGARLKKPEEDKPLTHCPQCRSRVGPKDRKCPTCGHRLKGWSLFS